MTKQKYMAVTVWDIVWITAMALAVGALVLAGAKFGGLW